MTKKKAPKEKLTKVLADSTNKKTITILTTILLTILLLLFKLETMVPNYYIDYKKAQIACPPVMQGFTNYCSTLPLTKSSTWSIILKELIPENEHIWVRAFFIKKNHVSTVNLKIMALINIFAVDKKNKKIEDKKNKFVDLRKEVYLECSESEDNFCSPISLGFQDIENERYRVEISFQIPENLKSQLRDVNFEVKMGNPGVLRFLVFTRYGLVFFSIFSGFFYFLFYKNIPENMVTYEHRFILWLTIGIIVANDPFYAVDFDNKYLELFLFFLFQGFFYFLLTIFILTMLDRIRLESKQNNTRFLKKKILYLALFFTILMTVLIFLTYYSEDTKDPIFEFFYDHPFVLTVLFFLIVALQVFLFFLILFKSFLIYKKWETILQRHRFFIIMSLVFYFFYMKAMVFEFLIAPLIFLNIYVFLLQISWRFSENGSGFETYLTETESQNDEEDYHKDEIKTDSESDSDYEFELNTNDDSLSISYENEYYEK